MTSIKDKIIIATSALPKQNQARDLELPVGADVHNIVHVLYSLNRHGLVGFRLSKNGSQQIPTNIFLTKQGENLLRRIK